MVLNWNEIISIIISVLMLATTIMSLLLATIIPKRERIKNLELIISKEIASMEKELMDYKTILEISEENKLIYEISIYSKKLVEIDANIFVYSLLISKNKKKSKKAAEIDNKIGDTIRAIRLFSIHIQGYKKNNIQNINWGKELEILRKLWISHKGEILSLWNEIFKK